LYSEYYCYKLEVIAIMNFALTLLVLLVASVASSPDIPYDGRNIHLSSQYRESYQRRHAPDLTDPTPEAGVKSVLEEDHHLHPEDKIRHYDFLNNPRHVHGEVQVDESLRRNIPNENDTQEQPYVWVDYGKAAIKKHLPTIQVRSSDKDEDQPIVLNPSDLHAPEEEHPYVWIDYGNAVLKRYLPIIPGSSSDKDEDQSIVLNSPEASAPEQHSPRHLGRFASIYMFAIFSLDNLFWLVPFVAHSPYNAVHFFITYQTLVVVSCVVGTSNGITLEHAHALNILCGGFGAMLCWCLAFLFYARLGMSESLVALMIHKRRLPTKVLLDEESGHADFLKESSDVNHLMDLMPITTPTAFLTVVMTVMAAVDDLFFVSLVLEMEILSPAEVYFGSSLAALTWICLATATGLAWRNYFCSIPLYSVLVIYASVMTGHSGWDYLASHWSLLVNVLRLHFGHLPVAHY
jgi:hypothetical protein